MVQTDRHMYFSLAYRLVEIALILLVITVERAFSHMNVMKAERINKMYDE
jgi:hypothetical protein